MTLPAEEAPANSVPAAAVIRRVQALIGITGRKAHRRRFVKSDVKSPGSTWELHLILASLSLVEGGRIPGVAVKCVEIWRNTGGEGGPLDED